MYSRILFRKYGKDILLRLTILVIMVQFLILANDSHAEKIDKTVNIAVITSQNNSDNAESFDQLFFDEINDLLKSKIKVNYKLYPVDTNSFYDKNS
ncbi:MAG: hypothetical protein AAF195_05070 [Pseudomonadota bacterium]